MIELINISKSFKVKTKEVLALSNINLKINDHEIFGIIGLSGAGKSTLVRIINLLERPTEGTVIIDSKNLINLSKKELLDMRRSIGMIFQNFNLFDQRTVLDNVSFPLSLTKVPKDKQKEKALELLKIVGLDDRKNYYPSQLSGGEKQRVAIARALATSPKYLLCDEATSALDPNNTNQILSLLKEINEKMGVTIIIITHEMKVIEKICDRVAVIDNSQIVEVGKVSEVFTNPKTDIAKELVLPESSKINFTNNQGKKLRLIFDGTSTDEAIIAKLVLETGIPVNILFADTKRIGNNIYGHMIIELPNSKRYEELIITWLNNHNISFKEEEIWLSIQRCWNS